jgi:type II secretory pathway component GspD/PulD (secretin)
MKKILSYFGLGAVLGTLLFSCAWAEEPKVITIEALAIEVSSDVLNEFFSPGPSETKGIISPDRIDTDKIIQFLQSPTNDKKVSLLMNPKITAIEGEKASLAIGESIFYMEKIDKDTFKLKKLTGKEGAGLFFEATPTITKDGQIKVDYKLTIQKVQGRAPIEGAEGFDIGYPLIGGRTTSANVVLDEGKPKVVSGLQDGGQHFLVILIAKLNK